MMEDLLTSEPSSATTAKHGQWECRRRPNRESSKCNSEISFECRRRAKKSPLKKMASPKSDGQATHKKAVTSFKEAVSQQRRDIGKIAVVKKLVPKSKAVPKGAAKKQPPKTMHLQSAASQMNAFFMPAPSKTMTSVGSKASIPSAGSIKSVGSNSSFGNRIYEKNKNATRITKPKLAS